MTTNKYFRKTMAGTVCFFLILGVVLVQNPRSVVAEEAEEYILEETIVTATKTGETKLQETPIAITVFDDQMLGDKGIFDLVELSAFTSSADLLPGFQGGVEGFIRGIGASRIFMGADASIAFYLDGVYLYQGRGANSDFLDVERIEMLRGPQGVAWGGNATGGAFNIITKKPSDKLEIEASGEIGNYSKRRVDAMISGPIIKGKINGRLSVSDSEHDGYIENLLVKNDNANENYTAFRGAVQILPRDNVEIMLRGDYYRAKNSDYSPERLMDWNSSFGQFAASLGHPRELLIPSDFWTINEDLESIISTRFYGGSAEMTIDLPHDITMVSLTAFRRQDQDHPKGDNDQTAIPEIWTNQIDTNQSARWWSQELRLTGNWGRLNWLLGGFYMDQENIGGPAWGGPDWMNPAVGPSVDISYTVNAERKAGFANLTYAFTDKLSGTAGVRYSDETKDLDLTIQVGLFPPFNYPVGPTIIFVEDTVGPSETWTAWTPKFVLDYKANEDLLLYARMEKGWRSGDLEPSNYFFSPVDAPVDPEEVWLYELGAKSDWFDKRLRVNAAVFYMEYEDLVVTRPLVGGLVAKENAGTIDYTGFEIEATARPTRRLTLNCAVTYMDTELGSFITENPRTGVFEDVKGNTAENVPEWKAVLGASYVFPIEGVGYLTLGANLAYRDKVHWTLFPEDQSAWVDDYTLVNARVRFETENGRWALEAYGRNVFEEEYYNYYTIRNGTDDTWGRPGNPRTVGFRISYKY